MNADLRNEQFTEEEINLRELILSLWRQKIVIISVTLIVAIITGIFSVFFISPVYDSKMNIVINMPEMYQTKYGDYTLSISSNAEYIKLITNNDILLGTIKDMGYDADGMTIEQLRKRITIGSISTNANSVQNSFEVQVSADNALEAKELAEVLYANYLEFLDVMTAENAVSYYYNNFSVQLATLEDELDKTQVILQKNEELLAETPKTINQKDALQAIESQTNSSDYIVMEQIINPNYTLLESNIIENKQAMNEIENSIGVYETYLNELDSVKAEIAKYYETGDFTGINSNIVSITKTSVYLPSQPVAPSTKTSPSIAMNVIIGTLLGGMLGVMIALFRWWWKNGTPDTNPKR